MSAVLTDEDGFIQSRSIEFRHEYDENIWEAQV